MTARRLVALTALAGLVLTGCASEQVTTSEPTTPPDTTPVTDQTTTSTSSTSTLAPPSTTEPPATTTTSTSTSTTTTAPAPDLEPAPETAFAVVDNDLVELDVASGEIVRVVAEWFNGDGVFRGSLQLTPDRTAAYFGEGYEDSWYGCESSVGSIGRVDLASGELEGQFAGTAPSLSTDGTRLAYLASEVCVPDPEAPELWVLTPYDRVVVHDLASGESVEITTATAPADYGDPNGLQWVGFHPSGDVLVLTSGGDLYRVPSTSPGVVQDHPVVASAPPGFPYEMIGESLLTVGTGDEGATRVVAVDLGGGGAETTLWESEYPVTLGVGALGHVIVADGNPEGSAATTGPVTVIALGEPYVYSVDW